MPAQSARPSRLCLGTQTGLSQLNSSAMRSLASFFFLSFFYSHTLVIPLLGSLAVTFSLYFSLRHYRGIKSVKRGDMREAERSSVGSVSSESPQIANCCCCFFPLFKDEMRMFVCVSERYKRRERQRDAVRVGDATKCVSLKGAMI